MTLFSSPRVIRKPMVVTAAIAGLLSSQVAVASAAQAYAGPETSQAECDTGGAGFVSFSDLWSSGSWDDLWAMVMGGSGAATCTEADQATDTSQDWAATDQDWAPEDQGSDTSQDWAPEDQGTQNDQGSENDQATQNDQAAEQQQTEAPAQADQPAEQAGAVALGDDYPSRYQDLQNSVVDEWGYTSRQCTSFVAFRMETRNGRALPQDMGDAKNWAPYLEGQYTVDDSPAVGSIAWDSAGQYGHVAWVAAVDGDNVTLEEYNYNVSEGYGTRTVPASTYQYIHYQDL